MGVTVEDDTPKDFEVWEENWESVEMFVACRTQWRVTSGFVQQNTGLDYSAVASLIQLWGVTDPKQTMDDVRVMEATALSVWSSNTT